MSTSHTHTHKHNKLQDKGLKLGESGAQLGNVKETRPFSFVVVCGIKK